MIQFYQRFRERDDVALRIAFDADLAEISSQSPPKLEHLDGVGGPNADAVTADTVEAGGSSSRRPAASRRSSRFLAVSLQGWSTVQSSRLSCGWAAGAPGK